MTVRIRRSRLALLSLVLVVGGGVGSFVRVQAAEAHSGLEDTSPRSGAVLDEAPTEIVLDFDEDIEPALSSVILRARDGTTRALDTPTPTVDHTQLVVPVSNPDDLGAGIYVVTYRVTSSDSHLASGSFAFQIGSQPGDQQEVLDRIASGWSADERAVGWALGVARLFGFVGLALVLGVWAVAVFVLPDERVRARLVPRAWTGLALLFVATAVSFMLQGPRVVGGGLGDAFDPSLWSDVASTRYGKALLVRLVLTVLAVLPVVGVRLADLRPWRVAAGTVAASLLLTFGLAGHAGSGRWPGLGVVLDIFHLGSVAVWIGGLVLLALSRGAWLTDDRAKVTARRFSVMAGVALPIAVVSGAAQTGRVARSLGGLSETTWGRTLIAKLSVVLVVLVLGTMARVALRRFGPLSIRRLVVAEAVVGLAVLGVTAGLVALPPELARPIQPAVVTLTDGNLSVTVSVTPGRIGQNDVHLTVDQGLDAVEPTTSATLNLALEAQGTELDEITMTPSGPDHYSAFAVLIPFAGSWDVSVAVVATDGSVTALGGTLVIPP
jgi:copper transport protein